MERRLRQILPGFLFVVFLMTICGSMAAYREHNNFTIGDWLINYSGGFVRRGLLGHLVLLAARAFALNPGVIVSLLHVACYAAFFLFSYLLLRRTSLRPYAWLIFSPFIFCFQINDLQGGYRKEILFFALLSFLAYARVAWPTPRFRKAFAISLLWYPALILSHEMLAVYLPYVIALGILGGAATRKQVVAVALWCVPSVATFLVCCVHHGTVAQENAIVASLAALDYPIRDGAVAWIHFTPADGLNAVRLGMTDMPFVLYVPASALSLVAFVPITSRVQLIAQDRWAMMLIACSALGSVLLAVVALDWGRFLYIHLVSWFILSLVMRPRVEPGFRPNGLIVGLVVIWALFFHLPHWPGRGELIAVEWKQVNFIRSMDSVVNVFGDAPTDEAGAR